MADEEVGLNHVDQESENVSDETISKLEASVEENNLFSKKKKKQKWQKSMEIYMDGKYNL